MAIDYLTRQQAREIDTIAIEEFGIPGIILMENAGRNCAKSIYNEYCRAPSKSSVLIACGPGNNGGDGLVIARHLVNLSVPVKVVLFCDPERLSGDAATNFHIVSKMQIPVERFKSSWTGQRVVECLGPRNQASPSVFIDALLGTGAAGPPRPPLDRVIPVINAMDVKRVSIDIPTGLDCDTGQTAVPSIRADLTLTFVALKIGFQTVDAQAVLGKCQVIDIGIPTEVINRAQSGL